MRPGSWDVFWRFLWLGCHAFGGPAAHVAFFQRTFVERLGWFEAAAFERWLVWSQMLPGPASSQLGFLLGYQRAGWGGALAAFVGFTLPTATILGVFGWLGQTYYASLAPLMQGWLWVAAAVVSLAVVQMSSALGKRWGLWGIGVLSGALFLLTPLPVWGLILFWGGVGAVWGFVPLRPQEPVTDGMADGMLRERRPSLWQSRLLLLTALALFGLALALPLVLTTLSGVFAQSVLTGFQVFGGGHVMLPLLEQDWVAPEGPLSAEVFMAGYGAVQAMPGPMFAFASFLGIQTVGLAGALVATLAIFLPGFLLLMGGLRYYQAWQKQPRIAGGLAAIYAVVVGLLAAAWLNPILVHALSLTSVTLSGVTSGPTLLALLMLAINLVWLRRQGPIWALLLLNPLVAGFMAQSL
ncbi:chromate efflux transporter [Hydrogenovibrio halophilus]|uniref:chromate efflux transporter n=1 Tax=Hydrogenovibrio halophilus TaxID=373391 RepID=UPI000376FFA4|nr:chromate efflux transporter [Hydrogenovibrio halophilus]